MKIVLLPLDERPCNRFYPSFLPLDKETSIVIPPLSILSDAKKVCDVTKLDDWLIEECKDADYAVISLDTLCYGGIIPSRLHHDDLETITKRSESIRTIKKNNPKIKIFVNELIMRCPAYSIAVEEPDYYDICGFELFKIGALTDKKLLGIITPEEEQELAELKRSVKEEYLLDLVHRREINKKAIMFNLSLVKEGIVDFFSIPQDDCAKHSFTCIDVRDITKYIHDNEIPNVLMYPGADEVGLDLIARCLNDYHCHNARVFIHYATSEGASKIPELEDRPINKTLPLHLIAAGCRVVDSLAEADILYMVNCGSDFLATSDPHKLDTLTNRDLNKFFNLINVGLGENKVVGIADVFYTNEADKTLFDELIKRGLLGKIHAFSGWNTSSNTIGTTTCLAVCNYYFRSITQKNKALFYRYVEDYFYMSIVRRLLVEYINNKNYGGTNIHNMNGHEDEFASFVKDELVNLIDKYELRKIYDYQDIFVSFPWHRTFEIFLEVK